MSVTWEDPLPRRGRQSNDWKALLEELMGLPREWACLGHFNRGNVMNLKRGKYDLPPGQWEFTSRTVNRGGETAPDGHVWIYARFMGGAE